MNQDQAVKRAAKTDEKIIALKAAIVAKWPGTVFPARPPRTRTTPQGRSLADVQADQLDELLQVLTIMVPLVPAA